MAGPEKRQPDGEEMAIADRVSTQSFWSIEPAKLYPLLESSADGLSADEAARRLARFGLNHSVKSKGTNVLGLLLSQFKSAIILILLAASILSLFLGQETNAVIIVVIIFISAALGFWQEYQATSAMQRLIALVHVTATVLRDSKPEEIHVENVVPGDVIVLKAGDVIPADSLIIGAQDLFVDEATLTGESYPVEKSVGLTAADAPLAARTNAVFTGTHVINGTGRILVVKTGTETEFGKVAGRLAARPPETGFEHGIRRFGYLLSEVTLILVIIIFAINVMLTKPIIDSLMFSLALAVGLTPQLLPAIISVNLARGAAQMARGKVIVKRLASIENLGSMNILCSDKTGTLTEGKVDIKSCLGIDGQDNKKTFQYAYINAFFGAGYVNPIDEAIRKSTDVDVSGYKKIGEIPYDFVRKRMGIQVSTPQGNLLIVKGALSNVLQVCSSAELPGGQVQDLDLARERIQTLFEGLSQQGYRVMGVAYRSVPATPVDRDDEKDLTFLGVLVLFDPLKEHISETLDDLRKKGISLKIITGDNHLAAAATAKQIGLSYEQVMTGAELYHVSNAALTNLVAGVDVFAELEPNQKERIIMALRRSGNVVGYLGDGINDASAIHAADVGISADSAVDVAKEAADIILLEKDLRVLIGGVQEGRKTFANTMKYIFMATSANFGNMFSMAGASLFLKFLPMLPSQVLLTNLLTDFPETTIATDSVDAELTNTPRRWNLKFIRNFMLTFGILSSVFDYATFGVLLWLLRGDVRTFQTGWFTESVISASMVVLVIRSRRPFFKSRPSRFLVWTTLSVAVATLLIPLTPLGTLFGFTFLPWRFLGLMLAIVAVYIVAAEIAKSIFYRHSSY